MAVGEVVVMRVLSDVFKRCSCRDGTGQSLNGRCPRLGERGHGSWYFRLELPHGQDGRRRQLRRGGFISRAARRVKPATIWLIPPRRIRRRRW